MNARRRIMGNGKTVAVINVFLCIALLTFQKNALIGAMIRNQNFMAFSASGAHCEERKPLGDLPTVRGLFQSSLGFDCRKIFNPRA